jgi:hypothetical protein
MVKGVWNATVGISSAECDLCAIQINVDGTSDAASRA